MNHEFVAALNSILDNHIQIVAQKKYEEELEKAIQKSLHESELAVRMEEADMERILQVTLEEDINNDPQLKAVIQRSLLKHQHETSYRSGLLTWWICPYPRDEYEQIEDEEKET